ncbi:chromosomal replication initiator protein DnaA [Candidatus Saccharibacteria bacterium]|nr:chromosomal replication initiator protein DnaA [Candidatus Saccharibacteria bacterium]
MQSEWQGVLDEVRRSVSEMAYGTYFSTSRLISMKDGQVVIGVPSVFIKTQMERKYNDVIKKSLSGAGMSYKSLEFIVGAGERRTIRRGVEVLPSTETMTVRPKLERSVANNETGLNAKYRFDNYVVGDNNNLAVSAAHAVVEKPGVRYNPYFIYGGPGVGKTHLVQAIGNEIVARNPNMRVLYTTIEQFYHEFVETMRKNLSGFTDKYRKVDVLIIDDFQFITGKEKSQIEFFHTFNELHQKNKQIIVSSDRLPMQIADVDARLSSRLMGGVPIDIQMPDFEVRCAILKSKAELMGAEIEESAIEYLAENVKTNIRELEGQLQRLMAFAEMRGVSPSEIINDGYLDNEQYRKTKAMSPKQVIDRVAKFYDLTSKDLLSTSRMAQIKTPRQIAMYLMNEELGLSTVRIGREFDKDHTTIMHGIKKIKTDMKMDFHLRQQLAALREKLYA